MKTCPGCRVVYEDDYNGTCHECGKPLGGVSANGDASLRFQWARQTSSTAQETSLEPRLKAGRYDGIKFDDRLMEVAKAGAFLLEKAAGRGNEEEWNDAA